MFFADDDSITNKAQDMMNKGEDWAKNKMEKVEQWAEENTEEAKQKLLDMARRMGVNVDESMSARDIANRVSDKIKEKI